MFQKFIFRKCHFRQSLHVQDYESISGVSVHISYATVSALIVVAEAKATRVWCVIINYDNNLFVVPML
jgi:hypothetical protein